MTEPRTPIVSRNPGPSSTPILPTLASDLGQHRLERHGDGASVSKDGDGHRLSDMSLGVLAELIGGWGPDLVDGNDPITDLQPGCEGRPGNAVE